jgi:Protein of unknown function (DUF1326)
MLVWHIKQGRFGDVRLDGFNLLALGGFEGNLWAGAKAKLGLFIDERADERQRQALQTIFAGQAGGWPAGFAATIGEFPSSIWENPRFTSYLIWLSNSGRRRRIRWYPSFLPGHNDVTFRLVLRARSLIPGPAATNE